MSTSYIPSREADMLLWAQNFSTLITANPANYGLTAGDATTIDGFVDAFDSALTTAVNPATKTIATVAAKNGAKTAMLDICRPYAQLIRHNLGLSNELKAGLGLTIVDLTPTAIPAPVTAPLLNLIGATPLEHTMRFSDQNTPDKRGKPFGVIGMQLFKFIGATPPAGTTEYLFHSFITRQPLSVDFGDDDVGKKAYYIGRWQNGKGETGPWSAPVSLTIV